MPQPAGSVSTGVSPPLTNEFGGRSSVSVRPLQAFGERRTGPAARCSVQLDVRADVAIGVHRHEGRELDEARVHAQARPGVARRNARDEALSTNRSSVRGQACSPRSDFSMRVDGTGHQRHASAAAPGFATFDHDGDGDKRPTTQGWQNGDDV